MAEEKVSYKVGDEGPEHSLIFDFGGNLQGAVKKFGEEVVYSMFQSAAIVRLQGMARGLAKGSENRDPVKPAEIEKQLKTHIFKLKAKPKSLADKMKALLDQMDPDEQAKFMSSVRKEAKAAKG